MPKIAFLFNTHYYAESLRSLLSTIEEEILFYQCDRDMDNVLDTAEQAINDGANIIVAYGKAASLLADQKLKIPVFPIFFSGADTINLLNWATKQPNFHRNNHEPRIALITNQPILGNLEILENVFRVKLQNIVVNTNQSEKLVEVLNYVRRENIDYVIGGKYVQSAAESMGITAFYNPTFAPIDSISTNIKTASVMATFNEYMLKKTQELEALTCYSFEAIIKIDSYGRIELFNPMAEKIFGISNKNAVNNYLWDIIPSLPESDIHPVLSSGSSIFGKIISMDEVSIVVNIDPIISQGKFQGAIAHFDEVKRIEKIETHIKANLYTKGHVAKYHLSDILGNSPDIKEVKHLASQFAKHNSTVLIIGESGTGKELFAQSIHNESLRHNHPFVAINCGALPMNLLESELFGYIDGAFTGASKKGKKGLLEVADKGTIFLDEIGEMEPLAQTKLLRVLEQKTITRIGDDREIPVDVRIIAATNKNLVKMVEEGTFREDLFYRLNVLTLYIPPLRNRKHDITLLANHFIEDFAKRNKKLVELSQDAMEVLQNYEWKGNIRQLKNFCDRLVITSHCKKIDAAFVRHHLNLSYTCSGFSFIKEIEKTDIPLALQDELYNNQDFQLGTSPPHKSDEISERSKILAALNRCKGNKMKTAKELRISTATLWRKIKKYQLGNEYY